MKNLIITVFILFFCNAFSQKQTFTTVIPRNYDKAKQFSLVNNVNDTIMSFIRNRHIKSIQKNGNNYILKKRKMLFASNGDTIAYYKRKKIIFPTKNIIVNEKKNKNGWTYYIDNNKILEINYKYSKNKENYYITATSKVLNELTANLLEISLGKFDKRVIMDYDDDNDFATSLIIAIIVAIS